MTFPPPLTTLRVEDIGDHGHLAWAVGETIRLPTDLARALDAKSPADGRLRLPRRLPSVPEDAARSLRLRAAFTPVPPASSRLPFAYHHIPERLRSLAAGIIGRLKRRGQSRWAAFPGWPLDLSADFLADLTRAAGPDKPIESATGPCPVILTHDLDSEEGLRNAVDLFLPLEEAAGARSVNFVVPCRWPLDDSLLRNLTERGHELGVHGYDHANLTPFARPEEMRRRVEAARPLVVRYAVRGYRAPSLLRTPALFEALAGLYAYDSSIPTAGGLFPVPNNGCASARPFVARGMPVLPLSMPRDGSLRFLGHSPKQILECWIACSRRIAAAGGCVVLLTHCEKRFSGNAEMLSVYRDFLEFAWQSDAFTWSDPRRTFARYGC